MMITKVDVAAQFITDKNAKNNSPGIEGEENANKLETLDKTKTITVKPTTSWPEIRQPKRKVLWSLAFNTIASNKSKIFSKHRKRNEVTNLVNTIEYKPNVIKSIIKTQERSVDSEKIIDVGLLVDCGESSDLLNDIFLS